MAIAFDFGAVSDVGLTRPNNQDSVYCSRDVLAVADGVGGGPAGEVASAVVAGALTGLVPGRDAAEPDPRGALLTRVQLAAESLTRAAKLDPTLTGMGTTLTAVVTGPSRELVRNRGGELGLVHIGDSRLYVLHAGRLFQLTRDHSLPQFLVDQGTITPAEAERHPQRNVIVRSLTPGGEVDADVVLLLVLLGQRLIVCSDGLSDYVPFERISELAAAGAPQAVAEALLNEALAFGSRDNVSVVVADVVEAGWLPPKELKLGAVQGDPGAPDIRVAGPGG